LTSDRESRNFGSRLTATSQQYKWIACSPVRYADYHHQTMVEDLRYHSARRRQGRIMSEIPLRYASGNGTPPGYRREGDCYVPMSHAELPTRTEPPIYGSTERSDSSFPSQRPGSLRDARDSRDPGDLGCEQDYFADPIEIIPAHLLLGTPALPVVIITGSCAQLHGCNPLQLTVI
jgi:hypothetical protein